MSLGYDNRYNMGLPGSTHFGFDERFPSVIVREDSDAPGRNQMVATAVNPMLAQMIVTALNATFDDEAVELARQLIRWSDYRKATPT